MNDYNKCPYDPLTDRYFLLGRWISALQVTRREKRCKEQLAETRPAKSYARLGGALEVRWT